MPGRRSDSSAVLAAVMIASVVGVGALAYWDEQREAGAALDDFAQEQATLAASVANEIGTRLAAVEAASLPLPELLAGAARLERPAALVVMVAPPGGGLHATDGRTVAAPFVAEALATGRATLRLTKAEAAAVGLAERTAMAGLAHLDAGRHGRFGVAVVASAARARDRERWARLRLALSTALAAGLVFGFGGQALRRQRRQFELQRQLELADVERERDERLARLSRATTMVTLASGVAHEISTPLGVISGRAEQLLQRAEGDERSRRAASAILDQCQRIKDVVRGLLDVARGGSPVLQAVRPDALAGAAVALVEHRFEKAGVKLSPAVPPSLPLVHCDPTLLEQALVNLLLNACDACARGGAVELSARAGAGGVTFVVADDGEGIAQVNVARATEPFFTTKPGGRGTGLGLAIVNEIAKCHRGSFTIEPGAPRGTRASLQVPVEGSSP